MRSHAAGYTLLELLVVIAIIGLIAALAAPSLSRTIAGATIDADARRLAGDLRHIQRIAKERQQTITIANGASGIEIEPEPSLALPSANIHLVDDTQSIRYFADGTTDGGTLRISETGRSLDIHIAWLTGAISVGDTDDAR